MGTGNLFEFLRNFEKRMEKLSYSFLIDYVVATKNLINNYGFDNIQGINLVYTLMCFVLDKSLKDEECTLEHMSSFLDNIISKYYSQTLDEEQTHEITRFIVYKVLRNDGKPFAFDTYNYMENKTVTFQYHLLQQRPSKSNKDKSTFYLTEEGYRLLLGSFEVDEKTQIDINQMILELSLKRKNFTQGLMAIENLNNLITSQINIINNFIIKTRENILAINQDEFEDNFVKNIEVLREQNTKFDELKAIIILEEKRLRGADGSTLESSYESLRQLGRIKELLITISQKAGKLINKHFEFKKEYIKALEDISYYYNIKKIDMKEHILKPIEEDVNRLSNIHLLLNPLFNSSLKKHFNINKIFEQQKMYGLDMEDDQVLIDDIDKDMEQERKLKEKKQQYQEIVATILEFAIGKRNTDFKALIKFYNDKCEEDYKKLVPSIRMLAEVVIEFLRIGDIDVNYLVESSGKDYVNEEIEFDFKTILVQEISKKYRLANVNMIKFYKSPFGEKVEVKEWSEQAEVLEQMDFTTINIVKCPNFIMEVE